MDNFLQTLWKNSKTNRQEELENIIRWCEDEETVSALVRFAYWDSVMRDAFPETMQDLYDKLEFKTDRADRVASPSDPAEDWTFTVYVIRWVFLKLQLPSHTKTSFTARPLSIRLLDDMEIEMSIPDRERTPSPHQQRRGRGTPEPERKPISTVGVLLQRLLASA